MTTQEQSATSATTEQSSSMPETIYADNRQEWRPMKGFSDGAPEKKYIRADLVLEDRKEALSENEQTHLITIKQRDDAEEMCDELSDEIARILGVEIGEHSSANFPWTNALEAARKYVRTDLVPKPATGDKKAALDLFENHTFGRDGIDCETVLIDFPEAYQTIRAALSAETVPLSVAGKLKDALGMIRRMKLYPDDKVNRTTLSVAMGIANKALSEFEQWQKGETK